MTAAEKWVWKSAEAVSSLRHPAISAACVTDHFCLVTPITFCISARLKNATSCCHFSCIS
jgi:hypothetical protein